LTFAVLELKWILKSKYFKFLIIQPFLPLNGKRQSEGQQYPPPHAGMLERLWMLKATVLKLSTNILLKKSSLSI
jgi:hypothetical protein